MWHNYFLSPAGIRTITNMLLDSQSQLASADTIELVFFFNVSTGKDAEKQVNTL